MIMRARGMRRDCTDESGALCFCVFFLGRINKQIN